MHSKALSRARIGVRTRVASTRASICCSIFSRDTAQREHSSRSVGLRITIHDWCVVSHKRDMKLLRTDIGTVASTHWRPKNFGRTCGRRKRCSKMCVVPSSGDSARPTFLFVLGASGRLTSYSRKDFVTTPACFRFDGRATATARPRWYRTRYIVRREHCSSFRSRRRRGMAPAFPLPAARTYATFRSASSVTASVSTRTAAFRPPSICIPGNWTPSNRVFLSAGSPERDTTVVSRERCRAWSSSLPSSALRRPRDA